MTEENAPIFRQDTAPEDTPPQAEVTEGLGSAALGVETPGAVSIPVTDAEAQPPGVTNDTRFDHTKAITTGVAAKEWSDAEPGEIDRNNERLDHRPFDSEKLNENRERGNTPEEFDRVANRDHRYEAGRLKSAQEAVDRWTSKGEAPPEDLLENLEEARETYEAVVPEVKSVIRANTKFWEKQREEAIKEFTSPVEEVYDLNPEKFAQMPTSEFIEVTKEFTATKEALRLKEAHIQEFQEEAKLLDSFLEKKQFPGWRLVEGIQDLAAQASEADWTEVSNRYRHEYDDNFERPLKEVLEVIIKMTKEYLEQSVAKFQELERKKQEFLDKYQKSEPAEVASSAQSAE